MSADRRSNKNFRAMPKRGDKPEWQHTQKFIRVALGLSAGANEYSNKESLVSGYGRKRAKKEYGIPSN